VQALTAVDVEDLRREIGTTSCAYYASHVLAGAAEVVVCPHPYILDPVIARCSTHHRENWSLKNRIVILDEAHNVEDFCRDAGSFDLKRQEVQDIIKQLDAIYEKYGKRLDLSGGSSSSQREEKKSERDELEKDKNTATSSKPVTTKADATTTKELHQQPVVQQIKNPSENKNPSSRSESKKTSSSSKNEQHAGAGGLNTSVEHVENPLDTSGVALNTSLGSALANNTSLLSSRNASASSSSTGTSNVNVKKDSNNVGAERAPVGGAAGCTTSGGSSAGEKFGSLSVMCMVPTAVFSGLSEMADTIILSSGTLHPHSAVIAELGTEFAKRLQRRPPPLSAKHVVTSDQFQLLPVKTNLPCTHENLQKEAFLEAIGKQILMTLLCNVPGGSGVLIFLSSQALVEKALRLWSAKILKRLVSPAATNFLPPPPALGSLNEKTPWEERIVLCDKVRTFAQSVENQQVITVLVSAYRSSSSEGLDLRDHLCRLVVCVGIPFPPYKDTFVAEKREYNNAVCKIEKMKQAKVLKSEAEKKNLLGPQEDAKKQ
ncbi:unnamed protein product, partial [Amoebophrya sp. A120]